jgi:hypothetical protein
MHWDASWLNKHSYKLTLFEQLFIQKFVKLFLESKIYSQLRLHVKEYYLLNSCTNYTYQLRRSVIVKKKKQQTPPRALYLIGKVWLLMWGDWLVISVFFKKSYLWLQDSQVRLIRRQIRNKAKLRGAAKKKLFNRHRAYNF